MEDNKKYETNHINNNEYSILVYLKNHTAITVTLFSAIIAICSFFVNTYIYLLNNSYLNYWNIDSSFISLNKQDQFYIVCSTLVFIVITTFINILINWSFNNLNTTRKSLVYINEIKTIVNKNVKNKQMEKNKLFYEKLNDKLLKKKKEKASNIIAILACIVLSILILYLVSAIFCFFINDFTKNNFYLPIIYSFVFTLTGIIMTIIFSVIGTKKQNVIDKAHSNFERDGMDVNLDLYDHDKLAQKLHNYLNNKSIIFFIIVIGIYLLIPLIVFSSIGKITAESQTGFYVIEDCESHDYAVIYNNGTELILEEAKIEDETITIDTTKQKIISAKDITLHKRDFLIVKSNTSP